MPPAVITILLFTICYLIGAIPFGYLVGRARGVDLFQQGSGNIGATNAGRVLGWAYGILVFLFDFMKGALPVAAIEPLARSLGGAEEFGLPGTLRCGAAAFAFLGHLFPIYLGFRGGKGVATGAGTVAMLVPGPTALAIVVWFLALLAMRMVSLASIAAVITLVTVRLIGTPNPFDRSHIAVTSYCLIGAGLVFAKHRTNIRRIYARTESKIGDETMRQTALRILHVLALGTWFGGAAFFSFVVAPTQNTTFRMIVQTAPNDRTAFRPLLPDGADEQAKSELASALFGAAVGPIFPMFFLMQAICGTLAFLTAVTWWNVQSGQFIHRARLFIIGLGLLAVLVNWPVSELVSEYRRMRYHTDTTIAESAKSDFQTWHFVSLSLSATATLLAGIGLTLAAKLPEKPS